MRRMLPLACLLIVSSVAFAQESSAASSEAKPELKTRSATATDSSSQKENKNDIVVPAGTKIPIQLKQGVSSKNARAGDAIFAETTFPVALNNRMVIPAGTYIQGVVSEVRRGGHIKGRAEVLMHFRTMIFHNGYTVTLPGAVDSAPDTQNAKIKDQEGTIQADGQRGQRAGTIATTAGTGAVIGGLGTASAKGALVGGAAGAAVGTVIGMLGRGNDVRLEPGTTLDMVFQRSITLDAAKLDLR